MSLDRIVVLSLAVMFCSSVESHATEPIQDWKENSVTKDWYNAAAGLPWRNHGGDWRDADGRPQGPKPFADAVVAGPQGGQVIDFDITAMVKGWLSGRIPDNGVVLRSFEGGQVILHSKERPDPAVHPRLIVRTADGTRHELPATDDVFTHNSTSGSLWGEPHLWVGFAMLKFDLSRLEKDAAVTEAIMRVYPVNKTFRHTVLGVFQPDLGSASPSALGGKLKGLAESYPGDKGLARDPDVLMVSDFERFDWAKSWTVDMNPVHLMPIEEPGKLGFEPLSGKALQGVIPEGSRLGLNLLYKFADRLGYEPEEIYMRYYLRLADNWNPRISGGKLPGIAGTYGKAGWGGRRSDGTNGWSMRGSFGIIPKPDNPAHGLTPVGTYAYFADMPSRYGSAWPWARKGLGLLERNRWYSIEQHVKLNTPGAHNGTLRIWVDGDVAFESDEIMYRTTDALKIDRIWMNVYHGGTANAPEDYHFFIDNVVIAKAYIGPMAGRAVESQ